jgi:uncharacterized protein YdeI (BOF family)
VKKLIIAGALLLAATGAQAQGTGNTRPANTGGTNDQHQQTHPTNTQRDSPSAPANTGATRNPRH